MVSILVLRRLLEEGCGGCGWKSGLRDAAGNEAVMKRRIAWQLHELLRLENTYVRGFMTRSLRGK